MKVIFHYGFELCAFCGGYNEPYMIQNNLWKKVAGKKHKRLICLSCVENKLGRKLKIEDFSDAPINHGCFDFDCVEYVKGVPYLLLSEDDAKRLIRNWERRVI